MAELAPSPSSPWPPPPACHRPGRPKSTIPFKSPSPKSPSVPVTPGSCLPVAAPSVPLLHRAVMPRPLPYLLHRAPPNQRRPPAPHLRQPPPLQHSSSSFSSDTGTTAFCESNGSPASSSSFPVDLSCRLRQLSKPLSPTPKLQLSGTEHHQSKLILISSMSKLPSQIRSPCHQGLGSTTNSTSPSSTASSSAANSSPTHHHRPIMA